VLASIPYCLTFFVLGPYLRELFIGPPIVITAIMLERKGYLDALKRAKELMATNWSRTLLYLITFSAGIGLLSLIIEQLALSAVAAATTSVVGYALVVVVSVMVPSLVAGYVACVWLIAYFDLRVRMEEFTTTDMIALRTTPPLPE
jgi:hypothetical protein